MIYRNFAVYIFAGVLSAITDIGAMQLMTSIGINYLLSTTLGFVFGLLVNYILQMKVTFCSQHSVASMIKFGLAVLMNYIIMMGVVMYTVYVREGALFGKILSLPFVAVNGFLLGRYWIFK